MTTKVYTTDMSIKRLNTYRYNTLDMKSTFLTFILLACGFTFAFAQKGDRLKERLRSERAAVYTSVLQLTSDEAQQFWPIFNQFIDDREKVQHELKNLRRDNLSDSEAETQIKKDRKSTRLNSSHLDLSRMPSSA